MSNKLKKGQKFNMLTVIKPVKVYKADGIHYTTQYLCRCDCGNIITVRKANLTRKESPTKSCGCLNDKNRRNKIDDLKDQQFGHLHVLYRAADYISPKTLSLHQHHHVFCKTKIAYAVSCNGIANVTAVTHVLPVPMIYEMVMHIPVAATAYNHFVNKTS